MLWRRETPQRLFPHLELESQRVLMRPPRLSDGPQWIEVRSVNKDHIQPFEPKWAENGLERDFFERRIRRQARDWELGQANAFLIFKKADMHLIGGMNINNICRGAAQYAAIGYWIDQAHEGQGYMAEAIQLTLEYCFEDLGLHRVNASCLPENTRSKNTLLKAGFKEEGFAEKYLQINGRWRDHELFGLPVEDWAEKEAAE